jgi:hypothetical protein
MSTDAGTRGDDMFFAYADSMTKRCRRLFRGNAKEINCLHVQAKFVGPASHCDGTAFGPGEGDKKAMLKVIKQADESSMDKGLPGPTVFDIV